MSEAAQLLGISRSLLWELAKEEGFPSFRLHNRQCIRVESLLAWIRAKEHPEREQSALHQQLRREKDLQKRKQNVEVRSKGKTIVLIPYCPEGSLNCGFESLQALYLFFDSG